MVDPLKIYVSSEIDPNGDLRTMGRICFYREHIIRALELKNSIIDLEELHLGRVAHELYQDLIEMKIDPFYELENRLLDIAYPDPTVLKDIKDSFKKVYDQLRPGYQLIKVEDKVL